MYIIYEIKPIINLTKSKGGYDEKVFLDNDSNGHRVPIVCMVTMSGS